MPETDITRRLPLVIAAYVKASNDADPNAFLGVFTDDAFVNDIQREFRGKAAIGKWAEREIFGANVTMEVMREIITATSRSPRSWRAPTTRPAFPIR